MKAAELRDKTVDDLQENLIALMKDQFNYRMQKSTGQLNQTHLLKEVAKDIARVKTVLVSKEKVSKEKVSKETAQKEGSAQGNDQ